MAPRVAAIVPCWQMARFVGRAVRSALSQVGVEVEVVVCDDGSTDDVAGALREFGGRVTLVRQENRGLPAARNAAVRASTADVVAFLDADDQWLPHKSRVQLAALDADPDAGFVYGQADAVGDEDPNWRCTIGRAPPGDPPARELLVPILREGNLIPVLTGMVRRDAFESVGGFDESLRKGGEDYDFWLRLSVRWPALFVPGAVAVYRLHETGSYVSNVEDWTANLARIHDRIERETRGDAVVADAIDLARKRTLVGRAINRIDRGDRLGARADLDAAAVRPEWRDRALQLKRLTYVPTPLLRGMREAKRGMRALVGRA